jgi:hypothetical protein
VNAIEYRQVAFQGLVRDTMEYGRTHPKIEPILESFGIKRPGQAPTPAAPAKK